MKHERLPRAWSGRARTRGSTSVRDACLGTTTAVHPSWPPFRPENALGAAAEFAYGLGAVIVVYGLMLCLHPWLPQVACVGSFLVFVMSLVTLSFLVTTPECWVPALGDAHHGFPYLTGAGRLVVKDVIMMGAALVTMADSAKAYLRRRSGSRSHRAATVGDLQ